MSVLKRLRTVCLGLGVLLIPNTGFSEDLPTPEDVAIKKKAKVDDFFSPYTPPLLIRIRKSSILWI